MGPLPKENERRAVESMTTHLRDLLAEVMRDASVGFNLWREQVEAAGSTLKHDLSLLSSQSSRFEIHF